VLGKLEAALESLEHIYLHTPRARSWLFGITSHDTQFDSLRSRLDFQAFMKRLTADMATGG
jgi:hypothetical protein